MSSSNGKLQLPESLINDYRTVIALDGGDPHDVVIIFDDYAGSTLDRDTCPNCLGIKGQGKFKAPTGDPIPRGRRVSGSMLYRELVEYPCPVCSEAYYQQQRRAKCGVPSFIMSDDPLWDVPGRETMVNIIQQATIQWIESHPPAGWLMVLGGYGSGKTFLMQRAVVEMIESGIDAKYVLAGDIRDDLIEAIRLQNEPDITHRSPDQVVEHYKRLSVLVIDQLDWLRQRTSGGNETFAMEHIRDLLDHRYQNNKATAIILNREWHDAGGGDLAPILSRARMGLVAETTVGDLRPKAGDLMRQVER